MEIIKKIKKKYNNFKCVIGKHDYDFRCKRQESLYIRGLTYYVLYNKCKNCGIDILLHRHEIRK